MTSFSPPLFFFFFDSLQASKKKNALNFYLSLNLGDSILSSVFLFSLLYHLPLSSHLDPVIHYAFSSLSFFLSSLYSFHESFFPLFLGPEIRDTSSVLLFLLLFLNVFTAPRENFLPFVLASLLLFLLSLSLLPFGHRAELLWKKQQLHFFFWCSCCVRRVCNLVCSLSCRPHVKSISNPSPKTHSPFLHGLPGHHTLSSLSVCLLHTSTEVQLAGFSFSRRLLAHTVGTLSLWSFLSSLPLFSLPQGFNWLFIVYEKTSSAKVKLQKDWGLLVGQWRVWEVQLTCIHSSD